MSSSLDNQQQAGSSSSSWRRFNANNSSSSPHSLHAHQNNKKHKLDVDSFWSWDDDDDDDDDDGNINPEDSDEDMFTVPDVEAIPPDDHPISTSTVTNNNNATSNNNPAEIGFPGKRRRGRNPVDKEYRRLKRLLRNRVSAQQARERKKVYVNDLESKAKELEDANFNLEEKISTLINENNMLRKVLMNTRPKVDESIEQK